MTTLKLETDKVFGSDGSGDQKKIWVDNKLIKLNSKFREASKEVSASILGKAFGLNIVEYSKGEYFYKGAKHIGCECNSYIMDGESTVPIIDMINFYNINIPRNMSALEYFNITITCVSNYTGIRQDIIYNYMMQMLVFDYLICNTDRHLTNIEFIYNELVDEWRLVPLYDHGQSFLYRDGGLTNKQIESELYKLKMKPFSSNPYKNLIDLEKAKEIATNYMLKVNSVYSSIDNIQMNDFHKKIVKIQFNRLMNR